MLDGARRGGYASVSLSGGRLRRRTLQAATLVVPLHDLRDADAMAAGAKALGLARMIPAGLPVPRGFCILATAYREHLGSHGLQLRMMAALDELPRASGERRRTLFSDLRRDIAEAPLADALRAEIERHYGRLNAPRVAVRSSAAAEDLPGHSFAGQYETFLGVSDLEGCLRAIAGCWASLWTERAFEYRARNGFDHLVADMAVIVQELIPAEAAGVVFTADPVSGRTDRIVVEGCWGLGEALVSGRVAPDRFVLARRRLRLIESSLAAKAIERVPAEAGGVREHAIASDRAAQPCLDRAALRRLGTLALEAERLFDAPQDVEWALCDGRLYLLQSRPITALPPAQSPEDRQIWTNANAGEVLPDVASPMTWSLAERFIDAIFGVVFDKLGLDLRGVPLTSLIAGRVYFNLNTFAALMRGLPGLRAADVTEVFGGAQGRLLAARRLRLAEEDIPNLHVSRLKLLWRLPGFLVWFLAHSPMRALPALERLRRRTEELRGVEVPSLAEADLLTRLHASVEEMFESPGAVATAAAGIAYLSQLSKLCRRWLGDAEGSLANRLMAGVGGVDSAEAGLALWRLAASAHDQPQVERILLSGESYASTRQRLAQADGGEAFLALWDAFMARHGHHTRGEVDIMNPRWSETPDAVLDLVRGYLRGVEQMDPVAAHRQRGVEGRRLAEECRRRLRNPLKRWLFGFVLARAQRGCAFRENLKSEAVRRLAVVRKMLLELGERLARRGVLAQREDIFFLRFEGLGPVVRGGAGTASGGECGCAARPSRNLGVAPGSLGAETGVPRSSSTLSPSTSLRVNFAEGLGVPEGEWFDVRQVIAERRAEYERNLGITPPGVVVGRFDPAHCIPDETQRDAELLSGVAVSAGVATGRARVILRADANERVLPGEILVAPFTDPGWTPYFLPAAGIVVDMGGQLSHGSIVARELGIPAVVNVGPATAIIRTGQTVEVDGNRGLVRILR